MRINLTQSEAENRLSSSFKNFFGDTPDVRVTITSNDSKDLIECFQMGQKLTAIKNIRDAFGCGLKEAKDCCDDLFLILEKLQRGGYTS